MAGFSAAAAALEKPGVLGVLCVDKQGLCLHSEGSVPAGERGVAVARFVETFRVPPRHGCPSTRSGTHPDHPHLSAAIPLPS